jgi:hypothetical protein
VPRLSPTEIERVIREDLFNELRWMIVAAVTWAVPLGEEHPKHLKVMAMDSALIHARSLYYFLVRREKEARFPTDLVHRDIGGCPQSSTLLEDRIQPINERLLHLKTDRSSKDPIKNDVVNLVSEIIRMWRAYMVSLRDDLQLPAADFCAEVLEAALKDGDRAAARLESHNPFRRDVS